MTIRTASEPLEMSQLRAVLNEQHYLIPHDGHALLNQAFFHYADHRSEVIRLINQTTPCGS